MRGKNDNGMYKNLLKADGITDAKKWLIEQGYTVTKRQGNNIKPIHLEKNSVSSYYMTIAQAAWDVYKMNRTLT